MSLNPEMSLPTEIGKPALRALSAAGITDLRHVAAHSDADLLALHGVGPKAVQILRASLKEEGQARRAPVATAP